MLTVIVGLIIWLVKCSIQTHDLQDDIELLRSHLAKNRNDDNPYYVEGKF